MEDIKVAGIQLQSKLWDKNYNLKKISNWSKKIASKVDLICFPELSTCGYINMMVYPDLDYNEIGDRLWKISEEVPNGDLTDKLINIARKLMIFLCVGIAEKDHDVVYNTQVLVGPEGYIEKYRKIHMPASEYPYYRAGYEVPVVDIGKCKIGISTCYDNHFPELARILTLKGAEIILMPFAWPYEDQWEIPMGGKTRRARLREWMTFLPSRAYDNKVFLICVDHVGKEAKNLVYPGVSMIFDPNGQVIKESKSDGEEALTANLKAEKLQKARSNTYYNLRNRRPEVYGILSDLI